jgi:hypothetical protein
VVGFRGEPEKYGNETYNLYVSEPEPKDGTAITPRVSQRQERISPANAGVDGGFDEMPW